MRTHIEIDQVLRRAIIQEIGERLRACLREDELPESLKLQLRRLNQLDKQSQPPVPDPSNNNTGKASASQNTPPTNARLARDTGSTELNKPPRAARSVCRNVVRGTDGRNHAMRIEYITAIAIAVFVAVHLVGWLQLEKQSTPSAAQLALAESVHPLLPRSGG
jgi:hypothetical protein